MDKALTWFIWVWTVFGVVVNVVVVAEFYTTADSFSDGWSRMTEVYDPFSLWVNTVETALFAPVFAAYWWRAHRRSVAPSED